MTQELRTKDDPSTWNSATHPCYCAVYGGVLHCQSEGCVSGQAPRSSKEKIDPLTERLRFLRPVAKYKFGKDQYYMVGEVMHEAADEIERLQRELDQRPAYLDGLSIQQWKEHAKAGWKMYAARAENEPHGE